MTKDRTVSTTIVSRRTHLGATLASMQQALNQMRVSTKRVLSSFLSLFNLPNCFLSHLTIPMSAFFLALSAVADPSYVALNRAALREAVFVVNETQKLRFNRVLCAQGCLALRFNGYNNKLLIQAGLQVLILGVFRDHRKTPSQHLSYYMPAG